MDFPTALKEMGKMAGEKVPSKIECVYQYTDEAGKVLFEVVRYIPKTFRQRRPDGKGGYIYNMEGVRLVPYNLPKGDCKRYRLHLRRGKGLRQSGKNWA